MVPVGVGEREGPSERPVDGGRDDAVPVGGERVVDRLRVRRVEPQGDTDARLGDRVEVVTFVGGGA